MQNEKILNFVLLVFTIIFCVSKLLVPPLYSTMIDRCITINLWTLLTIVLIMAVNSIEDKPNGDLNIFYFPLLYPFMIGLGLWLNSW